MTLPTTISLPSRRLWNQGDEVNCCLSCAMATCLEALNRSYPELAPLFHYWWARPDRWSAAPLKPSEGFFAAQQTGFCLLPLHDKDFTIGGARETPSDEANRDALSRRIGVEPLLGQPLYLHLPRSDAKHQWRKALAYGYPILLGFYIDSTYWDMKGGAEDTWGNPESLISRVGHAVAVLGYDDGPQHFIVQDSRGPNFGRGGQWFIPYSVASTHLIYSAWAIGASPIEGLKPRGG